MRNNSPSSEADTAEYPPIVLVPKRLSAKWVAICAVYVLALLGMIALFVLRCFEATHPIRVT